MKAVRLLEYGGQLVFNDVPMPTIASDEILVNHDFGCAEQVAVIRRGLRPLKRNDANTRHPKFVVR